MQLEVNKAMPNYFVHIQRRMLVFLSLSFLGALFWAKSGDPFWRIWFSVRTLNHGPATGVVILPKPEGVRPVAVCLHGADGDLITSGNELRQLAELGFAAVSIEYNQTNNHVFDEQFSALLEFIRRQPWADTNAVAWVGSGVGAQRILSFLSRHSENQPSLLVRLSGGWVPELQAQTLTNNLKALKIHCPVLLVHGQEDEIFPASDANRMASFFKDNGAPVTAKLLPGLGHDFGSERPLIVRLVGEYCKATLPPYQSFMGVPQRHVAPFWVWMLPAMGWAAYCLCRWWRPLDRPLVCEPHKTWEQGLRAAAVVLATLALAESGVHLVTPQLAVGGTTLEMARNWLVAPKMVEEFNLMAADSVWQGRPLKWLLDSVELSHYNRNELINWKVDEPIYRQFVLQPDIDSVADKELNWRRPLWESFYPRIRKEDSPEAAAQIVVRYLRERVTIDPKLGCTPGIETAWSRGITDEKGFEIIYVAALRSVGIGARLNSSGQAEYWTGKTWANAPRPVISSFL